MPAAGHDALTGFYDPLTSLTMREHAWRPALQERLLADLPAGGRIADVGCGTGTLTASLALAAPEAEVVGVDGDIEALALARAKSGADSVEWRQGMADDLPLEDGSVDVVLMTLLLHHLQPAAKLKALEEANRVLKAGGTIHIADFGRPRGLLASRFRILQALDGFPNTEDHASGRLPEFIRQAGFTEVWLYKSVPTLPGTLELITAVSPAG